MNTDFTSRLREETPDAIPAVAPDGKILQWNRAAEVIFGEQRDEAVGQSLVDLLVPKDRSGEERRNQDLFAAFAQVNQARQTREGTGLVLHLSRQLAELPGGGEITFRSEYGKGSTFTPALAEA